jgi:hypothetical protein
MRIQLSHLVMKLNTFFTLFAEAKAAPPGKERR